MFLFLMWRYRINKQYTAFDADICSDISPPTLSCVCPKMRTVFPRAKHNEGYFVSIIFQIFLYKHGRSIFEIFLNTIKRVNISASIQSISILFKTFSYIQLNNLIGMKIKHAKNINLQNSKPGEYHLGYILGWQRYLAFCYLITQWSKSLCEALRTCMRHKFKEFRFC